MTSMSRGLVLTTAMVLSSCTVLYLAFSRKIISPPYFISGNSDSQDSDKQILRSCLCSEEKKVQRKKEKEKKVKFADNVKEASDGAEKEQGKQNRVSRSYRDEMEEIMGMLAKRIAVYNGILRDRVRKIECS